MLLRTLPLLLGLVGCEAAKPEARCDSAATTGLFADLDGDGFGDPAAPVNDCDEATPGVADATDCDDADEGVNPGAAEVCGGADEDCDGLTDDADDSVDAASAISFYADADGDGAGAAGTTVTACAAPDGYVATSDDCDDAENDISPDAIERCDPDDVDEDCDGLIDDDDDVAADSLSTWYRDADGDGSGDAADSFASCDLPVGYAQISGDCDDHDDDIGPDQAEICDDADVDEDCDGLSDDADTAPAGTVERFTDADGDGYGDPSSAVSTCDLAAGLSDDDSDCDDGDSAVHPGAPEACDLADTDEDCDGLVEDADPDSTQQVRFFPDVDGDGYGDDAAPRDGCDLGPGEVLGGGDCDDADPAASPVGVEVCGGGDEDCDGQVDDADRGVATSSYATWYADSDGDAYGDALASAAACAAPSGYVGDATDCDDASAAVHPGTTDTCNGVDDDCDGVADGGAGVTAWPDRDGDGYGDGSAAGTLTCALTSAYAANNSDCDDAEAAIRPGATETCDGVDQDCSGVADDGLSMQLYTDSAGDGYGNTASYLGCPTAGFSASSGDCNDADPEAYPGAPERCEDGIDNDCDNVDATCVLQTYGIGDATVSWYGVDNTDTAGDAVAFVDDLTGDGLPEVVAGASSFGPNFDGAVYLLPSESVGGGILDEEVGEYQAGREDALLGGSLVAGDLDGDGAPDIALTSEGDNSSNILLYLIRSASLRHGGVDQITDAVQLTGTSPDTNGGLSLSRVGDLDGSGAEELALGLWGTSAADPGAVYLVDGALTGNAGLSDLISVAGNTSGAATGQAAAGLDFDADGRQDLAVGVPPGTSGGSGEVWLFEGPITGALTITDADGVLPGSTGQVALGAALAALDANNDGYGDLAVADPDLSSGDGRIYLVIGGGPGTLSGSQSVAALATATISGSGGERLGATLTGPCDLDGDGLVELAVGADDGGSVHLFEGFRLSGSLIGSDADARWLSGSGAFGRSMACGADFDGDGAEDLAVGAPSDTPGVVYVFGL